MTQDIKPFDYSDKDSRVEPAWGGKGGHFLPCLLPLASPNTDAPRQLPHPISFNSLPPELGMKSRDPYPSVQGHLA